ncbi:MAG: hypothetical protein ACLQDM_06670 [Bradyrhizobium sp.]
MWRADRRRKRHRHSLLLALIPGHDQPFGVLKHLSIGRAPSRDLSVGLCRPLGLHLAPVEAHGRTVAERVSKSTTTPSHRIGPAINAHYRFLAWLVPTIEKFPPPSP